MDARALAAVMYAWQSPPFKGWAEVRAYQLAKAGEPAKVVIWFNNQAFDARELGNIGEPEYAVRRASGAVERSPHAPLPPEPLLRLVLLRSG